MEITTSKTVRRPRAIALMSGGLDSTLAAKIVKDQGVEVIGLHLLSPFGCREDVAKSAENVGIPLLIKEKGAAYLDLVQNPRYGYGRNMNPCIDCRIFMFQLADVVRQEQQADFIVTGEVLGQRPMSQQRNSMNLIDKKSPVDGLVLRPLSAHLFEPTVAEQEGWVNREKLYQISGRSRKEQMLLAEKFGIKDYSAPGGGCLLTEAGFSARLKDFFSHVTHGSEVERLAQSELLRYGRQFRISESLKIILGRNAQENAELERLWSTANGILFNPVNFDGPAAIAFGEIGPEDDRKVGRMITRYAKAPEHEAAQVARRDRQQSYTFVVEGKADDAELNRMRI